MTLTPFPQFTNKLPQFFILVFHENLLQATVIISLVGGVFFVAHLPGLPTFGADFTGVFIHLAQEVIQASIFIQISRIWLIFLYIDSISKIKETATVVVAGGTDLVWSKAKRPCFFPALPFPMTEEACVHLLNLVTWDLRKSLSRLLPPGLESLIQLLGAIFVRLLGPSLQDAVT